jgi:hypothetical protein
MFSKTYKPSTPSFGSNWFQFQPADTVSCGLRQALVHGHLLLFFK